MDEKIQFYSSAALLGTHHWDNTNDENTCDLPARLYPLMPLVKN